MEEINGNTCKSEDTGLSPSLVDAVFKRNFASVRKAYQDQVNKDPNLSGTAIVKFTVLADGTVSKANVIESEWNNSELGKLVDAKLEAAFMRMRFPEPKGGETTITYPPIIFQL